MDNKKITEVMKALTALGYPSGSKFAMEPLDDDRCKVIYNGTRDHIYDYCIGIYDFEKHTFVD